MNKFYLTEDYQLQIGDYNDSIYHTWIPECQVIKATNKAILISIPNKIFKDPELKGETSFDVVDIWMPKKCIVFRHYNIETKKGNGWAWSKIYRSNVSAAIEKIKHTRRKFKSLETVTSERSC